MFDMFYRGYYPKGGGEVHVRVTPIKELRPIELLQFGRLIRITGRAFVAGVLPYKVSSPVRGIFSHIKYVLLSKENAQLSYRKGSFTGTLCL